MAIVQSKSSGWVAAGAAITLTLNSAPTGGNQLVAFLTVEGATSATIDTAGWSTVLSVDNGQGDGIALWKALGSAGSSIHVTSGAGGSNRNLTVYEVDDLIETSDIAAHLSGPGSTLSAPPLTQAGDLGVLIYAFHAKNQTYVPVATFTAVSPATAFGPAVRAGRVHAWSGYHTTTPGTYTGQATQSGLSGGYPWIGVAVILSGPVVAAPVADFTADDFSIFEGETVTFTDLSTGTPTSWLWDFGDGSTSTSQNPSHVYVTQGVYDVTLTATNASGSDSITKTSFVNVTINIGFEEAPPAGAIVEIYAAELGSARWDEALWDEAEWSTAGWQNVTPESVRAVVQWGSSEPEMGILSRPSAGSWSLDIYDPNRLLDPANEDGPYFGDLEPGLPVRISHRSVVIRQGIAESISHDFETDLGFMRVQDNIAPMANAQVPDDIDLGDTLFARARAAIAAAGLSVQVLPDPPGGDPALVPWVTGTQRSVWQWITDAAESVLHVPYIDRIGRLGFRAWASPLARARDLTATELIGLVSLVQYDGLFSVVTALDDDGVTIVERASSPPPRYGARTYDRNSATPDVADWLAAVLADRVRSGRRWIPGTVYPLTADSVEKYATIEAVEQISLSHLFTDPVVAADIIIVGGKITVTAKKDSEAKWWFDFQAAETATTPLITEDGAGFVLSEAGDQFLYPE